jgi:Transposase DDE domain
MNPFPPTKKRSEYIVSSSLERTSKMYRKLDSETGKAIYGQRKYVVEPPFGYIKSIMGFTSFILRGLEKVKGEFKLVSTAHNLRKIWLYLKANGKTLAGMCPALGN